MAARALGELGGDPDPIRSQAVIKAMPGMKKPLVADLQAAYDNASGSVSNERGDPGSG